jgi:hypothetical protein
MRRDARLAAWSLRPGRGDADALVEALSEVCTANVEGVVVGIGPGIDPGVVRLAVLAAGVRADVPVQICTGPDAGHAALHAAAQAVLSGYQETLLVGALAGEEAGAWPPEGRTADLDWRLSYPTATEQGQHRIQQHELDGAAWFARHDSDAEGDLLSPVGGGAGAAAFRLSGEGDGPRIASLAGGGADPAGAGRAVARAGERALHHVQLDLDVVDAAVIAQDPPAEQAATAAALGLPLAKAQVVPAGAPAVRALLALPQLLEGLEARDQRHGLLLSGGADGLGRATLLDTLPFA